MPIVPHHHELAISYHKGLGSLGVRHLVWFLFVFLASILFSLLLPPMQSNDEVEHWGRVWSVASGALVCARVPQVGEKLPDAVDYLEVRARRHSFRFGNLDDARAIRGSRAERDSWGACVYSPVAYVLPAIAIRMVASPRDEDHSARLVEAFFAARLANCVLMAAAVLFFLVFVPELRNLTLVLYSLPMVMQQTSVINQDSTIFSLMFLLVFCWIQRPSIRQLVALALVVALLTVVKVVYGLLLLLWVCALLRLRDERPDLDKKRIGALAGLALLPILFQLTWAAASSRFHALVPPWASLSGQRHYLLTHPFAVIGLLGRQFLSFFGRGHMDGGWTSVLGVLGYAEHEIGDRAYALLGIAIAGALAADAVQAPRDLRSSRSWIVEYLLPITSALLVIAATAMAMYLVFTGVGAETINGVQGRYLHAPYFIILAIGIGWAQRRLGPWPPVVKLRPLAGMLSWLSFGCCVVAIGDAFATVWRVYY